MNMQHSKIALMINAISNVPVQTALAHARFDQDLMFFDTAIHSASGRGVDWL